MKKSDISLDVMCEQHYESFMINSNIKLFKRKNNDRKTLIKYISPKNHLIIANFKL